MGLIGWEKKGMKTYNESLTLDASGDPIRSIGYKTFENYYWSYTLMVRFWLNKHFHISSGPYYSIMDHGIYSYVLYKNGVVAYSEIGQNGFEGNNDYGISSNLGYSFSMGKRKFFNFQLMNSYGIKNLWPTFAAPVQNFTLSFSLGVIFLR